MSVCARLALCAATLRRRLLLNEWLSDARNERVICPKAKSSLELLSGEPTGVLSLSVLIEPGSSCAWGPRRVPETEELRFFTQFFTLSFTAMF